MAEAYIGEIRMFAGNFAPMYWEFCNGQQLSISQFPALYSILGNTYGGTPNVSFALPKLSGRAPLGAGSGPGLTPRRLGEIGGEQGVPLVEAQIPQHSHAMQGVGDNATTPSPQGNELAKGTGGRGHFDKFYGAQANTGHMSSNAIGTAGSGAPHDNMQPYLPCNFIICTDGVFPPRP